MEISRLILLVSKMKVNKLSPAFFDDELLTETELVKVSSFKFIFNYLVFKNNIVIIKAQTTIVFVNKISKKLIKYPKKIYNKVSILFL